jgi:hypothetical protein
MRNRIYAAEKKLKKKVGAAIQKQSQKERENGE